MTALRPFCILILMVITAFSQEKSKPRVFITDSQSWEMSGGFSGNKNGATGSLAGGARPQTAEIIKTFQERCPDSIITMNKEKSDYIVLLEHEGGKGYARKRNKFALFNKDGDAVNSGSTRSVGNAVKDVCTALMDDWSKNSRNNQPTPKNDEKKN